MVQILYCAEALLERLRLRIVGSFGDFLYILYTIW